MHPGGRNHAMFSLRLGIRFRGGKDERLKKGRALKQGETLRFQVRYRVYFALPYIVGYIFVGVAVLLPLTAIAFPDRMAKLAEISEFSALTFKVHGPAWLVLAGMELAAGIWFRRHANKIRKEHEKIFARDGSMDMAISLLYQTYLLG
jgi:hypothetical protein